MSGAEVKVVDNSSFWKTGVLFFLKLKKNFFLIYLFLAALGLHCCAWAFYRCGAWGLLILVVCGLLIAVASLVAEHGL